jgi:hypothetical protein
MRIAANAKNKRTDGPHGSQRPLAVRLTVAEFEDISSVCVGGLIAYMVFIIGQLAWESKAASTVRSGCLGPWSRLHRLHGQGHHPALLGIE